MNVTIINGTNRINRSILISKEIREIALQQGHTANLVDISDFTELFRGEYILYLEENKISQVQALEKIDSAEILLFITPTYQTSLPIALKNFIELTKSRSLYKDKVIGLIGINQHGVSVEPTKKVLDKLLIQFEEESLVLSNTLTINNESFDNYRIKNYLKYCEKFARIIA